MTLPTLIPRMLALSAALLATGAAAQLTDAASAAARAQAILTTMSVDDKIGQMTMAHLYRFTENGRSGPLAASAADTLSRLRPGSVLSGGGDSPQPNTPRGWADALRELEDLGRRELPGGVPAVFGTDAVHGVNGVPGATLFPHNLGLGAAFDPALTQAVARATAQDLRALNTDWNFSPVADLGRDPRWGRFYETFGESPWLVADHVAAGVRGGQSGGVAATLKHFVAYGSPSLGLDRANAEISAQALHETFLPPFRAGVQAGALSVMVNSGSVNGVPAHASPALLQGLLRGEPGAGGLGFDGLVVSDWNDIDRLVGTHKTHASLVQAVAASVNAGVDLYMVPNTVEAYQAALKGALDSGLIRPERLDEATLRVLVFKARLGLVGLLDARPAGSGVLEDHRALARRAAAASLTLLENDQALPLRSLPQRPARVLVSGPAMDSAAIQLGGWSVNWQGVGKGPVTFVPRVSTLATALKATAPAGVTVSALPDSKREALLRAAKAADTVVLALGEPPAAEWFATNASLSLPGDQLQLLRDVLGTGRRVVLVLMAGRPIVLPPELRDRLDALVMAYLPGSQGGAALADALYGRAGFPGRLPFTWPDTVAQAGLTADRPPEGAGEALRPLYPLGYGLDYTSFSARDLEVQPTPAGVSVRVTLSNTGRRPGTGTFVVRTGLPPAGSLQPVRRPVGFVQAALRAGESRTLTLSVPRERLEVWGGDAFGPVEARLVPGTYPFEVGDTRADVALR